MMLYNKIDGTQLVELQENTYIQKSTPFTRLTLIIYENPIRYLHNLSSVFVAMYFAPTEESFGRYR
jgi:hypothetical protein